MNKKIQRLIEPGTQLYLFIMLVFAAATLFFHRELAIAEGIIIVTLVIYSIISGKRSRRELIEYIESITYDVETAKNDTLLNFPLPMVVFRLNNNQIVWGNTFFFDICGLASPSFEIKIVDLVPEFSGRWLLEGQTQHPGLLEIGGRQFRIHGNIVRGEDDDGSRDFMGITYWIDVTDYENIKSEYQNSRPVVALFVFDNYDEVLKSIGDREQGELRAEMGDTVLQWCDGLNGILRRYDRDKFIFIFEQRHLQNVVEKQAELLGKMREIVSTRGIHATASVGIGTDGMNFSETFSYANLAIEMALSRGGDQVVIKNRFNFEFFGGRGNEIETRTKVKSRVMANALSELINDASLTIVMGHKYADFDSLGAAAGICCMARSRGKTAKIIINLENNAGGPLIERLLEAPEYADVFISPQEAMLIADIRTLLVVVDTNRPEQVESETILDTCTKVAIIDHHRRAATYIQNAALEFYEPYASSACELVTELLQEVVEQSEILRCEAEAVLSGIVMDTKNFTIRTGERTFDAAAFLRRAGADTTEVKRLLQSDVESTIAKYSILQHAHVYRGGIAVATPDIPRDRVVIAQSADELLNIVGVGASIVACPTQDGRINISARSIGEINVQVLMESLGGGGNKSAAGAQIENGDISDVAENIYRAIDSYFDE